MFNIRRLEDININEVILKQQYYNSFINGNIEQAHKLIEDNKDLKFKVINAENLNKIVEHILSLENNYFNGVENILENHLEKYQIDINDLIYLRDYNSKTQYEINNFVSYSYEIYYCFKRPPVGTLPTDTSYWIYLGLHGDDSRVSLGVKYQGNWNNSKTYNKYNMVVYQNQLFVAKENNSGENPITSDKWSLQMSVEEQGIFVSKEEPPTIKPGNIWIQIL